MAQPIRRESRSTNLYLEIKIFDSLTKNSGNEIIHNCVTNPPLTTGPLGKGLTNENVT